MGIRSAVWGTIFLMLGRVARSPRVGHA
jgi:hypothetical protein